MQYSPNVQVIVHPRLRHATIGGHFERTINSVPSTHQKILSHPESPLLPHGTSAPAIIYALGHHGRNLQPHKINTLEVVRSLRDITYRNRRRGGVIHAFGMLDDESPYGSRAIVESLVRLVKPAPIAIILHLGVWHPTPGEFERGLNEIKTLETPNLILGSLFPVSSKL